MPNGNAHNDNNLFCIIADVSPVTDLLLLLLLLLKLIWSFRVISYVIFMAQELRYTLTKTKHLRLYGPAIIFISRYIAIQISSSGKCIQ